MDSGPEKQHAWLHRSSLARRLRCMPGQVCAGAVDVLDGVWQTLHMRTWVHVRYKYNTCAAAQAGTQVTGTGIYLGSQQADRDRAGLGCLAGVGNQARVETKRAGGTTGPSVTSSLPSTSTHLPLPPVPSRHRHRGLRTDARRSPFAVRHPPSSRLRFLSTWRSSAALSPLRPRTSRLHAATPPASPPQRHPASTAATVERPSQVDVSPKEPAAPPAHHHHHRHHRRKRWPPSQWPIRPNYRLPRPQETRQSPSSRPLHQFPPLPPVVLPPRRVCPANHNASLPAFCVNIGRSSATGRSLVRTASRYARATTASCASLCRATDLKPGILTDSVIQANVTCTPSTPAPARKRRRPNQDLQERLARCEELLKEYATAKPDSSSPPAKRPSPRPADPLPELEDPLPNWKPAGKLIEEGGGVRFMDSYLLTTVWDEVDIRIYNIHQRLAAD